MYVDGIGFANRCHYRSRCQRGQKHLSDAAISIARAYRHCRYRYREILSPARGYCFTKEGMLYIVEAKPFVE